MTPQPFRYVISGITATVIATLFLQGCDTGMLQSTEDKQLQACVEVVKRGLNDPNSFELLSKEMHQISNGTYRLLIEYTAKNAFGGRVKKNTACGFKTKNDVTLNPDDFMNMGRH